MPAFYGSWFMNRIKEGFAGFVNPVAGQKYYVPLNRENVICFVFWSKNYGPFLPHLRELTELGYRSYFNFTITGLPREFECNLVEIEEAIETAQKLSQLYSPKHINWRYDPVIISDKTHRDYHLEKFQQMCSELEGAVERCYFSFMVPYDKVRKNISRFWDSTGISIDTPSMDFQIELANELANTASRHNISLHTCCGNYLVNDNIFKAHCIDADIIKELFPEIGDEIINRPTRKNCGCAASTDIGKYDTCPHGCIYCYANVNKELAQQMHDEHDPDSAFLGYTKGESDLWVKELLEEREKKAEEEREDTIQTTLF